MLNSVRIERKEFDYFNFLSEVEGYRNFIKIHSTHPVLLNNLFMASWDYSVMVRELNSRLLTFVSQQKLSEFLWPRKSLTIFFGMEVPNNLQEQIVERSPCAFIFLLKSLLFYLSIKWTSLLIL